MTKDEIRKAAEEGVRKSVVSWWEIGYGSEAVELAEDAITQDRARRDSIMTQVHFECGACGHKTSMGVTAGVTMLPDSLEEMLGSVLKDTSLLMYFNKDTNRFDLTNGACGFISRDTIREATEAARAALDELKGKGDA